MAISIRPLRQLIPWAWGINGCASVISAVLAILLATHIGFRGVVVAAVGLYVLAALIYPNKKQRAQCNRNKGTGSGLSGIFRF